MKSKPKTGTEIMLKYQQERDQQRLKDIQNRLSEGRKGNVEVEKYYTADVGWLLGRLESILNLLAL